MIHKAIALQHYKDVLTQARAEVPKDFERAVLAHRMEVALRCAQFEARHTGPFNWSGKELKEDPEYGKWLDRINQCNDEQPDPMEDQGYDEQI